MEMFRRLFGQSGDEPDDPDTTTQPVSRSAEKTPLQSSNDSAKASSGAVGDAEQSAAEEKMMDDTPPTSPDASPQEPESEPEEAEVEPISMDGVTRKLPLETVIASRNAYLQFGQSTDVGMVRTNNQDAMLSVYYASRSVDERPDFGLFIVADGMGGHHDGEKASAIVTRIVANHVIQNIFMPMLGSSDEVSDRPPLTESLIEAIQTANANVLTDVPDGGTTVTAVAVVGDLAYFAHVGDSRAYLITKEGIEQITRDHSLVQRLIELDQLTPEEAVDHPQGNVLYRAIGQSDSLEVDALTRRLPSNSHLLLCSDGLWGLLDDKIIERVVRENPTPQAACDKLVALANTMGGKDNITAVMLHIPG